MDVYIRAIDGGVYFDRGVGIFNVLRTGGR